MHSKIFRNNSESQQTENTETKRGKNNMSYAVVTMKKGEGRTLKAGGAWVFDNEIESITGGFTNGSIVLVHDFDGYPMGRGFINQNSKIRIRMMTRDVHQEIDEAFLRMRVKNAWEYRKTTVDTSSCRLIFGEADFLPGLTVDKYEDVLVVECLALGMEAFKETIVNLLKEVLAEDGVIIRGVFERSDANERSTLSGRCGERSENRIFPGSEIQPSGDAAHLQGKTGAGLLYPYGNVRPERRNRRSHRGNRTGYLRVCRFPGNGKRKKKRTGRPGHLPLCECL